MVEPRSLLNNKFHPILIPVILGVIFALIVSKLDSDNWLSLERQLQKIEVDPSFERAPVYIGALKLPDGDALKPAALCSNEQYYLVSYQDNALVDLFSKRFEFLKRLNLSSQDGVSITDIDADANHIYTAESKLGSIRIHDFTGKLIKSIDWLPDGKTRLRPYGLMLYDGVLYVSDRKLQQVMAINIMEKPGISEFGELIFSAPRSTEHENKLFAPGFPVISPDGRLLVPTLSPPNIRSFTCSGRDMGYIIPMETSALRSPQGISFDQIPSPELMARADSIFDPSGILQQGRMHIADKETGNIHVFDPKGEPVLTYGKEVLMPIGLLIDEKKRIIVISDAADPGLKFYKF